MSQTVINNPGEGGNNNEGSGNLIIGIIAAIIFLVVLFVFIIPALQNSNNPSSPDVNLEVPKDIDVNVDSGSNN